MPHNPGMSEKAWLKFHELLAKFNLKYAEKILAKKDEEQKKVG